MSLQDSRSVTPAAIFDESQSGADARERNPLTKVVLKIFYKTLNQIVSLYRRNRYRILFAVYTFSVSWLCAAIIHWIQKDTDEPSTIFEAWFVSISCFSGCGLTLVDITQSFAPRVIMMIVAMQFGTIPLCSAFPSLFRLRSLWLIDCSEILPSDANVVRRHYKVNIVVVWVSLVYWFLIQSLSVMFLMSACQMTFWWSIFHTSSGFSQAGFPLDSRSFAIPQLIEKSQLLLLFIFLVPIPNTLFPVWQRLHVWVWSRLARIFARGDGPCC
ncbi:cation transporter, putative [Bodo saltans]|uniref:Cation transporter, putative n=1 Tax=Bodo saltans TaxID=75058 RepID=A0A0S4JQ80_BODSA|nr:cation transporter, putative [Bodo saltans]|eukprot:CUG92491.1 cation transporter, putative [Bodo saltans]